jgi:hypothetical protein
MHAGCGDTCRVAGGALAGGAGLGVWGVTGGLALPRPVPCRRGQRAEKSSKEVFTTEAGRTKMAVMKRTDSLAAGNRWPIIPKWEDRQVCLITC